MNFAGIFYILFVFSPFVFILVWAFRYQKKVYRRSWENVISLLREYKFSITSLIPENTGVPLYVEAKLEGHHARIWNEFVGTGKSRKLVTRCEIALQGTRLPVFRINLENVLTKIGEKIGIRDLKTGDPEFDRVFRLHSDASEETLRYFDLPTREIFLARQKELYGELSTASHLIRIELFGSPGHRLHLKQFTAMFELAMNMLKVKRAHSAFPQEPQEPGSSR